MTIGSIVKLTKLKMNCHSYKKSQEKVRDSESNTIYDKEESVLIISTSGTTSDSWMLDSDVSLHCTPCTRAFMNYQEGQFGRVYLGDNKECDIIGKGDVLLQ